MIQLTGGALIGFVNATWPFAKLTASSSTLRLRCMWDNYDFQPDEVVSLEPYGWIPVLRNGVRLGHARQDYPSKIVFWCSGNPEEVINQVREAGFRPSAPASSEVGKRGIPFRWSAVIISILVWNASFFPLRIDPHASRITLSVFLLLRLLVAFAAASLARVSVDFQKVLLKEGRSVNEIKSFLSLVQMASALLLAIFSVLLLTGAFSSS